MTDDLPAYRRSLEVHRAIEALYQRVTDHRAYFRAELAVDRAFPRLGRGKQAGARVDVFVCGLAIKAATTKRAILALCEIGDGDNALALSRVLLENASLLEWLIRGEFRRRLEAYAMFQSVVHERYVEMIYKHLARFVAAGAQPSVSSSAYHLAVWNHVFVQKGKPTKSERPTWNFDADPRKGHPVQTAELFREMHASFELDVLYGALGSDIVHSGPFTAARAARQANSGDQFVLCAAPVEDSRVIALAVSNTAMFLVLEALTEYIGLDLSAELAPLKLQAQRDPYGAQP